ncbi:MAG TPA: enoyl-CoA hydratase/isomerase family protein [Vicinamibacterales bacterium]|nr:enoyl-CoA hydratase/isomerase family protein [Vicinamibacterales bacterium]
MIERTSHGDIAVLRIQHGKANALDLELCQALTRELEAFRQSSSHALVITGSNKIFSAGVDLLRVVDEGAPYVRAFLPAMNGAFETLFSLLKPVVAAVNGHAIAGGCILAAAADRRLMIRDAGRIGIPELLVGVPFPVVPLEIMRLAAGRDLSSLAYTGVTYGAEEAQRNGLVDGVVDGERILEEAIRVAESLAAIPPTAFALTKRQLREPVLERIHVGSAIDALVLNAWTSEETLSAIRLYVERTLRKS